MIRASVSQLISAIDQLSREPKGALVESHVRTIKAGVKSLDDRVTALEKHLAKLERKW
jgi:hypothetical protein